MRRINDEVLVPARARRERAEAERQRVAIAQALDWATQALRELPTMANYAKVILTPNAQAALSGLLAAAEASGGGCRGSAGGARARGARAPSRR